MKVVFFAHYWAPYHFAGSEMMAQATLKALQAQGHEVQVIATEERDAPAYWEFDGIPVIRPSGTTSWSDLLTSTTPDLIITHHHPTPQAVAWGRQHAVPVVQMIHNDHDGSISFLRQGADFVIYNTEWVQNKFGKLFTYPSTVLHPPVWVDDHATERGEYITLVNMNVHKGSRVFYELSKRFPDQKFLAVEGGHGTQIMERWDNVIFQPQTTNMRDDVWSKTKILLMPSIYESYGMAAVEALASGIPVIANPTDGLLESLGSGGIFIPNAEVANWRAHVSETNGLFVDIELWAEELEKLFSDPTYYSQRVQAAFERAEQINPTAELENVAAELEGLVERWPTRRYKMSKRASDAR